MDISYHPLDLSEEIRGLVHTEKCIWTKVACELRVPLLVTKSLEDSNWAVQHTDAQVALTSGSSDLVMFLAAVFVPSASSFQKQHSDLHHGSKTGAYFMKANLTGTKCIKGMPSCRLAKVLGGGPCLHQDAASLL